MNERNTVAAWEVLFQEHRGTELAVLFLEALRIGLKKGTITGDDLRHIPVINGSVRGACFRNLRRGEMFEKVGFTASKAEGRNGSAIAIWRLTKPREARMILERVAGHFSKIGSGESKQTELF